MLLEPVALEEYHASLFRKITKHRKEITPWKKQRITNHVVKVSVPTAHVHQMFAIAENFSGEAR